MGSHLLLITTSWYWMLSFLSGAIFNVSLVWISREDCRHPKSFIWCRKIKLYIVSSFYASEQNDYRSKKNVVNIFLPDKWKSATCFLKMLTVETMHRWRKMHKIFILSGECLTTVEVIWYNTEYWLCYLLKWLFSVRTWKLFTTHLWTLKENLSLFLYSNCTFFMNIHTYCYDNWTCILQSIL